MACRKGSSATRSLAVQRPYSLPIRIEDYPQNGDLRRGAEQLGKNTPLTWNNLARKSMPPGRIPAGRSSDFARPTVCRQQPDALDCLRAALDSRPAQVHPQGASPRPTPSPYRSGVRIAASTGAGDCCRRDGRERVGPLHLRQSHRTRHSAARCHKIRDVFSLVDARAPPSSHHAISAVLGYAERRRHLAQWVQCVPHPQLHRQCAAWPQ
jgi:hypothetical protein